jgi:hypothetical protein
LFALNLPPIAFAVVYLLHSTQTTHALASPTRQATQHLCAYNFDKTQSASAERAFHHSTENGWRMVVVVPGDDDAEEARQF